ncbi:MAG: 1-acyl-sn-glycerol-3-phosphate acyltransferase, partial [Clostridia bacterium]|nr:1-acyl-sn-glycerol-3-phosphate acyltransferase [Clostridia bacterium]
MKANRFYRVVRAIVIPLLHMFFPYKITGKENVPAEGPVLLVSNHVSDFDPAFIVCGLNRKITYLGKKELFRFRILKWFFSNLGVIPVDRGGTDMHAMRASLSVLKEGGVLGIFPQGHRYKKDDNRDIENGASLLALK